MGLPLDDKDPTAITFVVDGQEYPIKGITVLWACARCGRDNPDYKSVLCPHLCDLCVVKITFQRILDRESG
jgi:hypothetical protein